MPGAAAHSRSARGTVGAVALTASLLGWALLAVLERRTTRAQMAWTWTAVTVLLVSLAGPLTAEASVPAKTTLVVMHLAVAAVLIPTLRRSRMPADPVPGATPKKAAQYR